MRKLLVIFAVILLMAGSAWGLDNRAIRSGALPTTSTFGSDTLGAYTGGDPARLWIINTLEFNPAGSGTLTTRSGYGDEYSDMYEGGLYDAIYDTTDNKVIVFEVNGVIVADTIAYLKGNNILITGATGPSPGIFIKGFTLEGGSRSNVVIQHLRIAGFSVVNSANYDDQDAISMYGEGTDNIVIDHCTLLWSVDELITFAYNNNVTVSNCIIAEGLAQPGLHPDYGPTDVHSTGMLLHDGVTNFLAYNNLFANFWFRAPVINGNNSGLFVNNYFYNIKEENAYTDGTTATELTMVGNVYEAGADSSSDAQTNFYQMHRDPTSGIIDLYLEGNCVVPRGDLSNAVCQVDNEDYTRVGAGWNTTYTGGDGGTIETNFKVTTPPVALGFSADATYDATPATQLSNLQTLKAKILANAGARPTDRISVENRIINQVSTSSTEHYKLIVINYDDGPPSAYEAVWPNSVDDPTLCTWNVDTITCDSPGATRALDTGMAASGLPPFPAAPYVDAGDGRDNLMVWIDTLSVAVESPYTPPPERSNDPSLDSNCVAWYLAEQPNGLVDSQGDEDLTGSEAGGVETEYLDGAVPKYFGRYTDERYSGTLASRAYTNITEVVFELAQGGDVTNRTCYVGKATMSGTSLDSITAWENQACALGLNAFTLDPVQSVSSGEAILLYMDGNDTTDYPQFLYNSSASVHDDLDGIYLWNADKTREQVDTSAEINLKITTSSATVSYDSLTQLEGVSSWDLEATDGSYLNRADASLVSGFPGKNGETNRIFSIAMIFKPESLPTDTNSMYLAGKEAVFGAYIYGDGAEPELRLALGDGDMDQVYSHESDLAVGTTYAAVFGWTNTDNTAFIRLYTLTSGTWALTGTSIESTANDFDLAASANEFEIGSYASLNTFDGTIDDVAVFVDELTAAQALTWAAGEYGEPAPTMTSLTISADTWDATDIDTYKTGTAVFSEAVVFSNVHWEMETGETDLECFLSSGSGTASVVVSCGPIVAGMRTLTLDFKDTDMTVSGELSDLQDVSISDLSLPASVTGAVAVAVPGAWAIPSGYADYAALLTAHGYLIGKDTIEVTDKANITIVDEDGTSGNEIKIYFRAGYSGTFDLGSNTYWKVFMHPSGTCTNCAGTGVDVEPFNGAAGL